MTKVLWLCAWIMRISQFVMRYGVGAFFHVETELNGMVGLGYHIGADSDWSLVREHTKENNWDPSIIGTV